MTTYMRRLLFALILAPLTSGAFTRIIDLPVDVSTSSEVETAIEFYQAESVQLDLYVKRNGVRLPLDSGLSVVWRAWVDGTPGTLYINATGTVYNATAGHCRVTLTPAQANPTNQTYKYTVQLYDGTTYMGVGASGDLVVRYAPQSGSVAYVGTTSYFSDTLGDLTPTAGRLIYGTGTAWATLASGTTGQVLTAQGSAAPIWSEAGSGSGDLTAITSTDGSIVVTSGTGPIPNVALPSTIPARNGSLLTALNASSLGSGTVPTERLGTGTANSGTFLTGAQTYAAMPFATTNDVRNAVSGVYLPISGGTMTGAARWENIDYSLDIGDGNGADFDSGYLGLYAIATNSNLGGIRYYPMGTGSWQIKQLNQDWATIVSTGNIASYGGSYFAPLSTVTNLNASALTSGTVPDARFPATLPAASGVNLTDVLHASSTLDATKLSGALPALDGSALTGLSSPQWAVEWGPGEIVGPFYDGANDAAGWSRKAEVNGTYPTGIAGMGMSSSLTTLQDVTIYVHRHTPKTATALDTNAAFELTFWTTTASAGDQKFDLVISGSNRSGGGQTTVFTKTGIVGAAATVTTLVIPVGAVSYLEKSDGTTTNQAESLSSSTLYRMYTFKIVAYSKSSNRVNFVGGVVNGR